MVVGTGFPVIASGMLLGTAISRPSTLTLMVSMAAGAGLVSGVTALDIKLMLRTGRNFQLRRLAGTGCFGGAARFVGFALGHKFIFELRHEALDRPGTGLTERANRAAARDVVGDLDQ